LNLLVIIALSFISWASDPDKEVTTNLEHTNQIAIWGFMGRQGLLLLLLCVVGFLSFFLILLLGRCTVGSSLLVLHTKLVAL